MKSRVMCLFLALGLLGLMPGVAWAQGDGEYPPVIDSVTFEISRLLGSGYAAYAAFDPDTGIVREGDLLRITVEFTDNDLGDDDDDDEDQEFFWQKNTVWIMDPPSPPEPPPFEDDTNGYVAPPNLEIDAAPATTGRFVATVEIPEWLGPNQARLRDPVAHPYDVGWQLSIELTNEEEPGDDTPVDWEVFTLLGVENPVFAPPNPPVVADAGSDVTVGSGSTVILDARESFDASNVGFDPDDPNVYDEDTLTFSWEWLDGPVRVDPEVSAADDRLAEVTLTTLGVYTFRVAVSDGVNAIPGTDSVTVTVVNAADLAENNLTPRALVTGPSSAVALGQMVTLDGRDSTDPDGDELTYRWQQTNEIGGDLTADELSEVFQPLSGVNSSVARWQATAIGTYYFRLLVADPYGNTDTSDVVTVEVVSAESAGEVVEQTDDSTGDVSSTVAPMACGGSLVPLLAVPLVLALSRGRRR